MYFSSSNAYNQTPAWTRIRSVKWTPSSSPLSSLLHCSAVRGSPSEPKPFKDSSVTLPAARSRLSATSSKLFTKPCSQQTVTQPTTCVSARQRRIATDTNIGLYGLHCFEDMICPDIPELQMIVLALPDDSSCLLDSPCQQGDALACPCSWQAAPNDEPWWLSCNSF